jgi:hypothetical protein
MDMKHYERIQPDTPQQVSFCFPKEVVHKERRFEERNIFDLEK